MRVSSFALLVNGIVALQVTSPVRRSTLTPRVTTASDFFEEAIALCERRVGGDTSTSLDAVPSLLRRACDEDYASVSSRWERVVLSNETCLCPKAGADGQQQFGQELIGFQTTQTEPGRQCRGGACSSACSRVTIDGLASASECADIREHANVLMDMDAEDSLGLWVGDVGASETNLLLSSCVKAGDVRMTLMTLRLIERLRRALAAEYGLPLASLRAEYGFVSRIAAEADPESYGIVHADESSDADYHYSAVLQLQSEGEGFEGGDFCFTDPLGPDAAAELRASVEAQLDDADVELAPPTASAEAAAAAREEFVQSAIDSSRLLERFPTRRGRAMLFSSGWENVHFVDRISSGVRFAMPIFFSTSAEEHEAPSDDMPTIEDCCAYWSGAWD